MWTTPGGKLLDENGGVIPNFQTKLTSYQRNNLRLLTLEEDPQMQTALSRMRSRIEILEESEEPNNKDGVSASDKAVSPSDSGDKKADSGEAEKASPEDGNNGNDDNSDDE